MPDLRLMMWFTLLMMTVVSERPTPNCLEIDGESSLGCVCPIKFNKVRLGQSWKYRIHDHQTRLILWLETLLNKTYQLKIEPLIFFLFIWETYFQTFLIIWAFVSIGWCLLLLEIYSVLVWCNWEKGLRRD